VKSHIIMEVPFPCKRIVVIGVTGSGKSAMAEKLARRLGLDFIELDALFWKPNWGESSEMEFREKVEAAIDSPGWVLAGNYSKVRDIVWPRAEAVIWLDYPFWLVFGRLWKRTWRRWWTKELLWGTNYERLIPQFKLWSKESLFFWQVYSFKKHRREYPEIIASSKFAHLKVFRFRKPAEAEGWLGSLAPASAASTAPA
jgi:hypothetical protein